ncbi:MAG: aminopeptidase P family N-terminal domain-containing protein [Lachnospiraceae bacterium]|nr:aminopeptidase P family N-terminal domain-containing protein [Lachnospiraceae bacterium]
MTTDEKLALLRKKMKEEGIDWFLILSSDYHSSEYVGDYFKVSEFFSACTSDNVELLIGRNEAKLWTDGRYFISAAKELAGSGIELMRSGEKGVPSLNAFLRANVKKGEVLAFDGRCINEEKAGVYEELLMELGASLLTDIDPAEGIWRERPPLPCHPVFLIPDELAGASFDEKLAGVREAMAEKKADWFMLSKLDDIAWLLNARGSDVFCNPVMLAYALIGKEEFHLFIQEDEVTDAFGSFCAERKICLHAYGEVFSALKSFSFGGPVMLEKSATSDAVYQILIKRAEIVEAVNPTELMKAVKNPVEIENIIKTYLLDSAALTHFIYWFKTNVGKMKISELSAAANLDARRAALPGYIGLSFPTISAYGANAAMAHYAASENDQAEVRPRGFLLVDSGGQYLGGTTDVTRTMAAGPLTAEEKRDFTLVTVSNLNLLNARFLYGATGKLLDAYARAPLWEYGINYNHGTGHGIGYILNVHEGPQNIRWKFNPGQKEVPFEAGMLISDEPGVYIEGKYGIRIETILLTVPDVENEFGRFLKFQPLTWAPIDLEAIDTAYMQPRDIERLNAYHEEVYEKLAPYFEGDELAWLREATRPISRNE